MKTITYTLTVLFGLSFALNIILYNIREKPETGAVVYNSAESPPTVVTDLPGGGSAATAKLQKQLDQQKGEADKLRQAVDAIPEIDNIKQIKVLTASNSRLELNLSQKDMVIVENEKKSGEKMEGKDKELAAANAEIKVWKDKFNSVKVDNTANTVAVVSEISPKIIQSEKREHWFQPKVGYTTITSENPAVKFYGMESYQFKNDAHRDFMEVNLRTQMPFLNTLYPKVTVEALFNPDGRLKFGANYGYFWNYKNGKLYPSGNMVLEYNLFRF